MNKMEWNRYLARGVFEPAFYESSKEQKVQFDPNMYPKGVNADFFAQGTCKDCDIVHKFQDKFEGEDRDISKARGEVMDLLRSRGLGPGCRVLDVGAGTGLFVRPISAAVGASGFVYATEVSDVFKGHLDNIVSTEKLSNVLVELVPPEIASYSSVPEGSIDIAIIIDVYHHFEFPKTTIRAIRRALKPDTGIVVIVDFIRDPVVHKSHPFPWIMQHVRADQSKFRREIQCAGLRLLEEPVIAGLDENYTMIFGVGTPVNVIL